MARAAEGVIPRRASLIAGTGKRDELFIYALLLCRTMHMVARKELGRAGHYNSVPVAGCCLLRLMSSHSVTGSRRRPIPLGGASMQVDEDSSNLNVHSIALENDQTR